MSIADQVLSTVVKADGSWFVKASTLTAGTYVITASARDPAGNAGNATQTLIDAINPLPVDLERAASYSVLAGTDVTSSGATHLSGDLGLSLSGAIVGLPAASVDGRTDDKNDAAAGAQTDAMTAYSDLAGRAPLQQIAGDLVGRTFQDGVYHAAGAITLTGILTLDAENVPDARFVFQIAGALSPAAGSSIQLINGAQASNVFWVAAGAVSTDSHVRWQGTLLSLGAVTLGQGSSLAGQALAKGSVLLADNQLTDVTGHPPTVVPAPMVPPPVLSASIVRAPVLATARSTAPVNRTAVVTAPVSQTEVSTAPVGQTGVARAPVVPAPVAGTAAGLVAVLSVAVVRPDSGAAPPLPACTAPSGARPHGVSFVPTTALRSTDHPPVSTRTCAAPAP